MKLRSMALATLVLCGQLTACAEDSSPTPAPISTQAKDGKSTATVDQSAANAVSGQNLQSTVNIDTLTNSMAQLEAQRTDLTKKLSLVSVATASTGIDNITADQENAKHSSTADGIGLAAGAATVAFSVATGGIGGLILGGLGAVSSGVALSNDAAAQKKHDETIKANSATLEQAASLRKNFQGQLDAVNAKIVQLQAQIDAYNAAQLKQVSGK
ncbi:MAG: hypothetical protein NTZ90_01905 [Proteobacteria bacterium]|nr:hypothetical protein [Pseudomonadota bacterium]